MPAIRYTYADSPIGRLLLTATGAGLTAIEFPRGDVPRPAPAGADEDRPSFDDVLRQLEAYFTGRLRHFDLQLAPAGTEFQRQTWAALCEIPYGETRSYAEIARRIGRPRAIRAVGAANGSNPLPVVVSCHRVIGGDGDLTGFGGGLERKRFLLRLEGALPTGLFA